MDNIKEKLGQSLAIAGLLAERAAKGLVMVALPVAMFTALCILFESIAGTLAALALIGAVWAAVEKGQ